MNDNTDELDDETILARVQASLAFEGLDTTSATVAIGRRFLDGKITSEEAIELLKQSHGANDSAP